MKRIIIADSGLNLNDDLKKKMEIKLIPFFLNIGDDHFTDDENFDVKNYLDMMSQARDVPKTAAPSPDSFIKAVGEADEAFIVTISSKLSTTYNSAIIAKQMLEETNPEKKIHVFDSLSAVSGETVVALKIQEGLDENKTFDEIVSEVEAYRDSVKTLFILENLENLVKNGRMSRLAGTIASALSITPICAGIDGKIEVVNKVRGMKSAINKMIGLIGDDLSKLTDRKLVIAHIDNLQRAIDIKEKIEGIYKFKEVIIVNPSGLSSTYANKGGIVIAY